MSIRNLHKKKTPRRSITILNAYKLLIRYVNVYTRSILLVHLRISSEEMRLFHNLIRPSYETVHERSAFLQRPNINITTRTCINI